ncbi:MAG: pyridoxal phosphate-dependent aminotransferase [Syntrophobacteraceae bacterium]
MKKLSRITNQLIGQPMFKLLHTAQEMERAGRRILHFEIGDPSFDSPICSKNAAKDALDKNLTHYTSSLGLLEYRQAVIDYTERNYGFRPSLDQVLACSANTLIDFVVRCVVNPGEEVIYPDPGFSTYLSVLSYNGMTPVPVQLKESNSFRMNPDDVRAKITDRTRLIIMNSPSNPTGSVMSKEEVEAMAELARERDIYLMSDEVYSTITYDGKHYSPCSMDECSEWVIVLNSLSKAYSMSGWRLGYAVGPPALIDKMGLLLQTILSCYPAFTQLAGRAALLGDQGFLAGRIETLRRRRDFLISGLNELPGISCTVPEGAFYAMPNITGTGLTAEQYCARLLEEAGVCLVPGTAFGQFGQGFARVCYASTTMELLEEALEKMAAFHHRAFSQVHQAHIPGAFEVSGYGLI